MQKIAELRIDIMALDGRPVGVGVSGPIADEIICFWALEKAKDAIKDHLKSMSSKPQLALPNGPMPNLRTG